MRIAIIAPGLHRVSRGAEVALETIGRELAKLQDTKVCLIGSGQVRQSEPYQFIHVGNVPRERFESWPKLPIFRNEYVYEEFTFLTSLMYLFRPQDFDITLTCSYPFVNWWLKKTSSSPAHIYVTQNGDHPALSDRSEYAWFDCDGLVCTNPEYFDRNRTRWFSQLITNGVDATKFSPKSVARKEFDLPEDTPVALMVSALTSSKRVLVGIRAASQIPNLHLVICGDGPERDTVKALAQDLMPGRCHIKQLPHTRMPDIYATVDIFIHMSMDEPFGNVYLEALATGLPIVAHDRPVTRWILEDTSTLVNTQDLEQVVSGIKQALKKRSAEAIEQRRALVRRRFTWQAIAQQYFDFLKDVLERKKTVDS